MQKTDFMEIALDQAEEALCRGEFPVGCVIADQQEVFATGARQGSTGGIPNEVDHAEIIALRNLADRKIPADRKKLTIYCTMEPCLMCFGAIILSGIPKIVYAYEDVMGGGVSCNLMNQKPLYRNARMEITPHVLREKSLVLFKRFFGNPANGYWRDSLLARYTLEQ